MDHDMDPDNFYFNSTNDNYCYYTDDQYNQINRDGKLSIIHINSRSLYPNFANNGYLSQFIPLNTIAISETWIKKEKEVDFELDGYEFMHIDRQSQGERGGNEELLSTAVDNVLECITNEIYKEKN